MDGDFCNLAHGSGAAVVGGLQDLFGRRGHKYRGTWGHVLDAWLLARTCPGSTHAGPWGQGFPDIVEASFLVGPSDSSFDPDACRRSLNSQLIAKRENLIEGTVKYCGPGWAEVDASKRDEMSMISVDDDYGTDISDPGSLSPTVTATEIAVGTNDVRSRVMPAAHARVMPLGAGLGGGSGGAIPAGWDDSGAATESQGEAGIGRGVRIVDPVDRAQGSSAVAKREGFGGGHEAGARDICCEREKEPGEWHGRGDGMDNDGFVGASVAGEERDVDRSREDGPSGCSYGGGTDQAFLDAFGSGGAGEVHELSCTVAIAGSTGGEEQMMDGASDAGSLMDAVDALMDEGFLEGLEDACRGDGALSPFTLDHLADMGSQQL